tara:strand:+ start:182 stop:739 length:558 start_codon:yes stop_codon:yes gene_type:complete
MKNKYNLDIDLTHKKLKNFEIYVGFNYFICCSSFLKKDKGLKFLDNTKGPYFWKKKVIDKSELIINTNYIDDLSIFLGHVILGKRDHFFILHGGDNLEYHSMPPLGFFKYVTSFKRKLNSFNCISGKISFFSDRYVSSDFKNKKIIHEFKVKKGNYSIYSICDETEKAKKVYSVSPEVGVLLVKN